METQDVSRGAPRLLIEWEHTGDRVRYSEAGAGSLLAHLAVLALLPLIPAAPPPRQVEARQVTPLVAPPMEPTQKAPNQGPISKQFDSRTIIPRPSIQIPPSPPSTTREAARIPAPPVVAPPAPEPPKIETAEMSPPPSPFQPPAAPPPPSKEPPKLAFESPNSLPQARPQGLGRAPGPAPSGGAVQEAVRALARGGSQGGLTVGDTGEGAGGIGDGLNLPPSPGKSASKLELLSDPMGVDFRPYLIRILAMVRRNWFAVIPEGVRLGQRGSVAIQFAIAKDGHVPKLVIAGSSGVESLDRAAVAGISASNPFPALPPEFRGGQIRLQFVFQYNAPVR